MCPSIPCLVLSLTLLSACVAGCATPSYIGDGPVRLSPGVQAYYQKYRQQTNPLAFQVWKTHSLSVRDTGSRSTRESLRRYEKRFEKDFAGRIEVRRAALTSEIAFLQESHAWPSLQAVGKITATRETQTGTSQETRYFLLSEAFSPERFLAIVRAHWGIENGLHWVLDVTMNEDGLRNRKDHGPENLALLRRLALNLATLEPSKASVKAKLKRAGWDNAYLVAILAQAAKSQVR